MLFRGGVEMSTSIFLLKRSLCLIIGLALLLSAGSYLLNTDGYARASDSVPQRIEYTMPGVPGLIATSTVSYAGWLEAGERIVGFVELTGQYYSSDSSYSWKFQILDPNKAEMDSYAGHWVSTPRHEFNCTVPYSGAYVIKVSHWSMYDKHLVIEVSPTGWKPGDTASPSPNQVPTAYIDTISPSSIKQGKAVSFTGHGIDPDGSIAGYSWRSNIDGQLSTSSSFNISNLSAGIHTIYFKVRDNKGVWSPEVSKSITISPPNQKPTAYVDSMSPSQAKVGDTVAFSGHGTDPDGSVIGYSWRSSVDGQLSNLNSFSTSKLSQGIHTIYFKVKDNDDAWSEEVSGTVTVELNKPPVAYIDSTSPDRLKVGGEVSFSGYGTDSDGSIIGYSWRSSVDGQLSTSSSFKTSNLSEGNHTIYFKVRDDDESWSDEVSSKVVIESNRPPVAYIDSITPSRVEQNKNVSFAGHGEDSDGSVAGYSWRSSIDGELSTSPSFATATLSAGKHTIYFKVKDSDGLWSEEVSSTLLVEQPGPYVELYGHRTKVAVGEEVILNLSVINPITSPGALTVQLTLSVPSGWSITSSGFGHGAGGLRTNTYEIEQGPNPRTIDVNILANEPYDGAITGYLDYYFAKQKEDAHHTEVNLKVTATPPSPPSEEAPTTRPKNVGPISCSSPVQGAPAASGRESLLGWMPIALCWGGLAGGYKILRWRKKL